ncbi:MAG: hypothetical protein ACK4N5_08685 [Myxococcales bacterium]
MKRLELEIPPDWDAIKACWDRCMAHLRAAGLDEDTAYALSMASQELLENAVKYGSFDEGGITLTIEVAAEVTIEVRTPTGAAEARLRHLDETIQWIRGFQDPFEAYVERLKAVSAEPYREGHSGLGLVRVAYEARCLLDFYVDERDTLAISAVYQPSNPAGR